MTDCPRPGKKRFHTQGAALAYAFIAYPGTAVNTYRCECGMWHVGNPDKRKKKPVPLTQRIEVPDV